MATIIDLDELRKEIEEDRKNIAEKEEILAANIRYLEKKNGKTTSSNQSELVLSPSNRPSSLAQLGENIINRTLREDVQDILPAFWGQEFTNANVEAVLGREGIRPRITTELNNLVAQGVLELVSKGQGRTPSVFKVKDAGHESMV